MISLMLPCEVLERILLLLNLKVVLKCRLVNKEFNEIIQSSTLLQYFLACEAAGVIDNPHSPLSYRERFEALKKREDAWKNLKPMFETTIKVNHQQSPFRVYCLTGGIFFLDDNNLIDLNYCHLPSSPQDNPRWNTIPCYGPEEGSRGMFVNFDTAIYEHDLIINVTSSEIGNQADAQQYSLDLVLFKFSTREYHPHARCPRIHLQKSPEARPRVIPSIVGEHLACIIHSRHGTFPDKLFIFDWKIGNKRLEHETIGNAYSYVVFVSPEILLVPNLILSRFEVWHLPPYHSKPELPVQILALSIPSISPDYSLVSISCNGEPNPFLHSMPYLPPRPFFPSLENSIIIVGLCLDSLQDTRRVTSTLIMPRSALLDTIQKWTSSSLLEQLEDLPMWLMNDLTVYEIIEPDGGSVRLDAQSKLVVTPTFPSASASPTLHISADLGSSSISLGSSTTSSKSRYEFLTVQWADWGPAISRWFQVNEDQWIASSTGQRYAFSVPNPHNRSKLMVSVADFNQHNVRRNMARLRREGTNLGGIGNHENGKEHVNEEELERLDHEGVFSEDIYMGLKCVVYHTPDEYDFDGVLMDEERLLGLKLNRDEDVESIKVLYFG